ncbi:7b3222cf-bb55-4e5f-bccd-70fcc37155b5 [Thermothielavioides terrestris]|jgi:antitoxin component of RelBE/YafQ-DinJ toxin-antitoxin module
MRCL